MTDLLPQPIRTARLVLLPLEPAGAQRLLAGDFAGVTPGAGWPHVDTMDGLGGAASGGSIGWLVTVDGVTIGDCGTLGLGDATGAIEIGYGLAEPYRRQGYGTELVRALSQWLLDRPPVRAVTAATEAENIASIRVLEHAGFQLGRADGEHVWYTLSGSNTPIPPEESRG
jgi:RimJ/RimL family protein N-acetyltransferase